jgi:hypothetical protein
MAQSPKEFADRLKGLSIFEGRVFGRLRLIYEEEATYRERARNYKGYWALSDAFKCFFLETIELTNGQRSKVTEPLSAFYGLMVPRLVSAFRYTCGAEHLAEFGYPLEAFTIQRNIFDLLVLTSAALQKFTDFYKLDGLDETAPSETRLDFKKVVKLRRKTERAVISKMLGADSGLSQSAQDELAVLNRLFDNEVHGARLSFAGAAGFLKGQDGLSVVPSFVERNLAMYLNRAWELEWMLHRLLPLLQPVGIMLPDSWADKWRALDDSFRYSVNEMTAQLGKAIGAAFVEFVDTKFPFDASSPFPL